MHMKDDSAVLQRIDPQAPGRTASWNMNACKFELISSINPEVDSDGYGEWQKSPRVAKKVTWLIRVGKRLNTRGIYSSEKHEDLD